MEKIYDWLVLLEDYAAFEKYFPTNKISCFEINRKKICLIKRENEVFVFDEKCPHNGASLANGYCTDQNEVVCPLHRYHFDLNTGKGLSGVASSLTIYPVKIEHNKLLIGFKKSINNWWK